MAKKHRVKKHHFKRHVKHAKRHAKVFKPKSVKHIETPAPRLPLIEKMPDERAFDLLKKYKIPVTQQIFIKRDSDLQSVLKKIGFPCVMKVSGEKIIHKTEFGGVKLNIQSMEQAQEAFKQLMKIRGAEKVLIQKQLSGLELITGVKRNHSFGAIITAGIGGVFVEVLRDVTYRVCPISLQDAEDMVRELKGYEVLKGFRGGKPINFSALYETLIKVSKLAVNEKIKEMDVNPLFCNENGCFAADVRIIK